MHDLVTTLGHGLGYKFKPWEAVRWAKRLNVAAQIAMTAFQIHQEVNKAYAEERRERAELLELRRQVKIAAEGLIEEAREEVEPLVQRFYEEVNLPVVALEKELAEVREDRSQTAVALRGLESRSRASLLLMSAGRAEGSGA